MPLESSSSRSSPGASFTATTSSVECTTLDTAPLSSVTWKLNTLGVVSGSFRLALLGSRASDCSNAFHSVRGAPAGALKVSVICPSAARVWPGTTMAEMPLPAGMAYCTMSPALPLVSTTSSVCTLSSASMIAASVSTMAMAGPSSV